MPESLTRLWHNGVALQAKPAAPECTQKVLVYDCKSLLTSIKKAKAR